MTIVVVTWLDSSMRAGWNEIETITGGENPIRPVEVLTVGWIIEETDDYITLASGNDQDGGYSGISCIPKLNIIDRSKLRKA